MQCTTGKMDDQGLFGRRKVEDEGSIVEKKGKFFNEELSQLY